MEEEKVRKQKELEDEQKRKREEEIQRMREEERRRLEEEDKEVDMLSQKRLMESFGSEQINIGSLLSGNGDQ